MAEMAERCGGGVHGEGGDLKGGTVVRTWPGPAGKMRESWRASSIKTTYTYFLGLVVFAFASVRRKVGSHVRFSQDRISESVREMGGAPSKSRRSQLERLAEATMSDPYLPAETLDHVVDLLHNTRDALRNCSLVSKSWIPRTRKHLFSIIKFPTEASLQSWKKTFPDPSSSPARYTKILTINCTPADAEVGDWIRAFSRVEHLEVGDQGFLAGGPSSLIPFYGFSPAIKSLRASFLSPPPPHVFNLVLSFPLLEHLTVIIFFEGLAGSADGSNELPTAAQPSGAPMLTGSLDIHLRGGMKPTIRQMLSLPSGIHFRKLTLTWFRKEDLPLLTALVEACSHTLESLDIAGTSTGHLRPHRISTPYYHSQVSRG